MRVGQLGRDVLPHAAYPKGEKHSGVRHLLRELQTVAIVLRALLGKALEARQVGRSHVVQVRGVAYEAGVIKRLDRLGADVDVHGPTADKVHDPPLHLRRAAPLVRAVMRRLTLHAHQRRTTLGTLADECHRCAIHRLRPIHPDDLRNDLATLLDIHAAAEMEVEPLHDAGVMQRGTADGGPGQQYRLEVSHRRHHARTPHLVVDRHEARLRPLGLKLIRNGPPRTLRRGPERTLLPKGVYLEHNAVRSHGQAVALGVPMRDVSHDFLRRVADTHGVGRFESPPACGLQIVVMIVGGQAVA